MHIVIFITAANKKEAGKIAAALVKSKTVACVNVIDKVESFFWWQGKIEQAPELLLIAKSTKAKLNQIIKLVKSLHSYEVPEIIALPITGGSKKYLEWIDAAIR
jgi:periplasmic divalent cation tolerance protein